MPLGTAGRYEPLRYVAHCDEYTVAEVKDTTNGWIGVGVTWNPSPELPHGFPTTFGNQMWFILPDPIAALVLDHERTIKAAIGLASDVSSQREEEGAAQG